MKKIIAASFIAFVIGAISFAAIRGRIDKLFPVLSTGNVRVEWVRVTAVCSSSPCTIASQSGPWVTSITRLGAGLYRLEIASGTFSAIPICFATPGDGGGNAQQTIFEPSTTAGEILCVCAQPRWCSRCKLPSHLLGA